MAAPPPPPPLPPAPAAAAPSAPAPRQRQQRRNWTKAEDELLRQQVALVGVGRWTQISKGVAGRNAMQCRNRWIECLDPAIKKGKWSPAEDLQLCLFVESYGDGRWAKVSTHIQGRASKACRNRFRALSPQLRRDHIQFWSSVEDRRLADAVTSLGLALNTSLTTAQWPWVEIAARVRTRNPQQCRIRYDAISSKVSGGRKRKKKHGKSKGPSNGSKSKRTRTSDSTATSRSGRSRSRSRHRSRHRRHRHGSSRSHPWSSGNDASDTGPGSVLGSMSESSESESGSSSDSSDSGGRSPGRGRKHRRKHRRRKHRRKHRRRHRARHHGGHVAAVITPGAMNFKMKLHAAGPHTLPLVATAASALSAVPLHPKMSGPPGALPHQYMPGYPGMPLPKQGDAPLGAPPSFWDHANASEQTVAALAAVQRYHVMYPGLSQGPPPQQPGAPPQCPPPGMPPGMPHGMPPGMPNIPGMPPYLPGMHMYPQHVYFGVPGVPGIPGMPPGMPPGVPMAQMPTPVFMGHPEVGSPQKQHQQHGPVPPPPQPQARQAVKREEVSGSAPKQPLKPQPMKPQGRQPQEQQEQQPQEQQPQPQPPQEQPPQPQPSAPETENSSTTTEA